MQACGTRVRNCEGRASGLLAREHSTSILGLPLLRAESGDVLGGDAEGGEGPAVTYRVV